MLRTRRGWMISEPRDRETGWCFEVTAVSRGGRDEGPGKRQITGILHHESRLSLNVSHQVLSPHHQSQAVIRTQSTHLLLYNRSLRNVWPGIVKLLSIAPGKATKCPIVIFRHYTYFCAISCFARRRVCLRAAVRRVTLETDTSYTRDPGPGHSLVWSQFTVCCGSRGESRVRWGGRGITDMCHDTQCT